MCWVEGVKSNWAISDSHRVSYQPLLLWTLDHTTRSTRHIMPCVANQAYHIMHSIPCLAHTTCGIPHTACCVQVYQRSHHEADIAACLDDRSAFSASDLALLSEEEFVEQVGLLHHVHSPVASCALAFYCGGRQCINALLYCCGVRAIFARWCLGRLIPLTQVVYTRSVLNSGVIRRCVAPPLPPFPRPRAAAAVISLLAALYTASCKAHGLFFCDNVPAYQELEHRPSLLWDFCSTGQSPDKEHIHAYTSLILG